MKLKLIVAAATVRGNTVCVFSEIIDFAADLTLFPEYTNNYYKYYKEPEQSFLSLLRICGIPLWEGGHPPLALSPYGGCVAILCSGFDATFMPWP